MKKIIGSIIVSFLVIMLIPVQQAEASKGNYTVNVKTTLKVYEKPNRNSKVVGSLKNKAIVYVYKKEPNGWSKIKYNNKTRYVASSALKIKSSPKYKKIDNSNLISHAGITVKANNIYFEGNPWIFGNYTIPRKDSWDIQLIEKKSLTSLYTLKLIPFFGEIIYAGYTGSNEEVMKVAAKEGFKAGLTRSINLYKNDLAAKKNLDKLKKDLDRAETISNVSEYSIDLLKNSMRDGYTSETAIRILTYATLSESNKSLSDQKWSIIKYPFKEYPISQIKTPAMVYPSKEKPHIVRSQMHLTIFKGAKFKKIGNISPTVNTETIRDLTYDINRVLNNKKTETKYGSYAKELVNLYNLDFIIKETAEKGYTPRVYSKFSTKSAQTITENVMKVFTKASSNHFTSAEIHKIMQTSYEKPLIDEIIRTSWFVVGKDNKGNKLYSYKAGDFELTFYPEFIWKATSDAKPPVMSHYTLNGREYLEISQYFKTGIFEGCTKKIYLNRNNSKSSWKVYNYKLY